MHHLPGLLPRVMEACNIDGGVPASINECTPPCKGSSDRNRTFLALTRATVSYAESSDVLLCAGSAILAEGLPDFILVRRESPVVAAHTRSHAFVWAERACTRETPAH